MIKVTLLITILALVSFSSCTSNALEPVDNLSVEVYQDQIQKWRKEHESGLKADDGWLTLAGLFWLEKGKTNSVGVGKEFDIQLPGRLKPGKFGVITMEARRISLSIEPGITATVDGRKIENIELASDENGKPTIVNFGDIEINAIKRKEKTGIRIRDKKSVEREEFNGLNWFPIDQKYELIAEFEPFKQERIMLVPNVLNQAVKMKSPGIARFVLDGREFTLQPALNGDGRLFFIFRDLSSRTESYGAGRFLYTEMPENGRLKIDFNKAENPPCAYTDFATCPLPPPQNDLRVKINAGEKHYGEH